MKPRFSPPRPARRGKRTAAKPAAVEKEEICFGIGSSTLGLVLVATSEKGVVAVLTGESENQLFGRLEEMFSKARLVDESRDLQELVDEVVGFIEKPRDRLELKLDLRGTPFRQQVWEAVRRVPMGQTSSYSEIAKAIGADKAVRAVGSACAESPMALVIPCHRVLRKDGSTSGSLFWGQRQRELLEREAAAAKARKGKKRT